MCNILPNRLSIFIWTSELLDDPESTLIVAKGPPPLNRDGEETLNLNTLAEDGT